MIVPVFCGFGPARRTTISAIAATSRAGVWIAALAGALLAAVFLGCGLRRWIARPLEAMGRSAREIAGGDLDVALPDSRIREIAEVRDGFEAMLAGLRQSLAEREAFEEERRFFIGAIAHDLRTPLFALRGYLEGLEQGIAASPEQAKNTSPYVRTRPASWTA
ncbi:HAMP domain-containing protein [Cohnella ginsengisoli]|uniref:histidine kinase n=1 Tax=Cohnella ginsengisoli TaxID=425004 RepID=A0A9X4KMI8_9BACL|nr:HAMP domain-containing protein [Cohnella ginsengisoli]MDG0795012.1 HAMP domain-containing protein [Cohnella ginsengisoli]